MNDRLESPPIAPRDLSGKHIGAQVEIRNGASVFAGQLMAIKYETIQYREIGSPEPIVSLSGVHVVVSGVAASLSWDASIRFLLS